MMEGVSNQRNHFRLEYPPADRPSLIIGREAHEVVDLSEQGIKFLMTKGYKPKVGDQIKGQIKFRDGKTVDVAGKVLRLLTEANQCVLTLTQGLPLPKMMEEQRYLLQKYRK
jgi:hypothetical protein